MQLPAHPIERPTGPPALRRVEVVINPASGGVGPDAVPAVEAILAGLGLEARVSAPEPESIEPAIRAAIAAAPELLVTLAGDGTARLAAELCGPKGPLVAPLPGGTMNMLPRALYGRRSWQVALTDTLSVGVERMVSGGEVGAHRFYCAAILGSPALWGRAREAVRAGQLARAWRAARLAFSRAFLSRLRFQLDDRPPSRAVALSLICPMISRALDEERALEAAVVNVHDALEAFRLGFANMLGDWRADPAVSVQTTRRARVWARQSIPALLDGELHSLGRAAEIRFLPHAFRALAPEPDEP
ncbi:MAG TPA: diacylglycerol kinase family protein [Caulobacteraceae bacterium]